MVEANILDTKLCCSCTSIKEKSSFYKDKSRRDGYGIYCKKCVLAKNQKSLAKTEYSYKKNYGLALSEYNELFEKQKGCCAICGEHQANLKHKLHVDHNHSTGEIRSLLCKHCNFILGHSKESIDILQKTISYLREHSL